MPLSGALCAKDDLVKYFFILYLGVFIFSGVNASEIQKTETGYFFELDAPSGQVKFVEFSKKRLFEKALLKFKLNQKYNNPEWPSAINIQFENTEYKLILLWSLQKPSREESYILETMLWAGDSKYPDPITVVTEYSDENDMELKVAKATTDEYTFSINNIQLASIPFPVTVNKITIGLQSSSGTVEVEIPNKDSVDGT